MKRRNQSMRFGAMSRQFINMIDGDPDGGGGGDPAPAPVSADPGGDPAPVSDPAPSSDPAPVDYFSTAPEDWRSQMLTKAGYKEGEDFDKAMKQLDRVSDMGGLAKNYLEAQSKIRAGEISDGLPENPTDEQMANWREAHGIPQAPEEYSLSLDEGLELTEGDDEAMKEVFQIAHSNNVAPDAVNGIINSLLKYDQSKVNERISQDGIDKQMTDKQLKEAWAGDYSTNLNMIKGLVNQLPADIKEDFEGARMPDGTGVFNNPSVMVAMAEWARKINPAATVVPNSSNPMQTMNDEITALESRMGESGWHKDIDAQTRYQSLITAKEQMSK